MADLRKVYTITVDFTAGSYEISAVATSPWQEFLRHVKERLTRDLPASRESAKAELVSITEA
jgi:hypothetical protein